MSTTAVLETPKQGAHFDIKLWGWSVLSVVPWFLNKRENIQGPSKVKKEWKKPARPSGFVDSSVRNSGLRFRPYVSKVPWHTGSRGFLSQLFPRYGHYCGPNWSSGKDGGSLLWDKRPIDWLDYCCYCHDIGYDAHDQAELLKADLAFLECLERPRMTTKGDPHVAHLYKTMCISGTRSTMSSVLGTDLTFRYLGFWFLLLTDSFFFLFDTNCRSPERTYTLQRKPFKVTVWAIIGWVWMAKQCEMERMELA